jgi:hypothetical protein
MQRTRRAARAPLLRAAPADVHADGVRRAGRCDVRGAVRARARHAARQAHVVAGARGALRARRARQRPLRAHTEEGASACCPGSAEAAGRRTREGTARRSAATRADVTKRTRVRRACAHSSGRCGAGNAPCRCSHGTYAAMARVKRARRRVYVHPLPTSFDLCRLQHRSRISGARAREHRGAARGGAAARAGLAVARSTRGSGARGARDARLWHASCAVCGLPRRPGRHAAAARTRTHRAARQRTGATSRRCVQRRCVRHARCPRAGSRCR